MESFELLGYWWLPEDRGETSTAGRLTYERGHFPRLEIHGTIRRQAEFALEHPGQPVIQGMTEDGKEWTLFACRSAGTTTRIPGYPIERYDCGMALRNVRYGSEEVAVFDKAWVEFDHLADWCGESGISRRFEVVEGQAAPTVQVNYAIPETREYPLPEHGGTVSIVHGARQGGGTGEFTIKESVAFKIDFDEPLSIEDIQARWVFPLRNFISLATDSPNAVVSLRVGNESLRRNAEDPTSPLVIVDVFLALVGEEPSSDSILPPWMLFNLPAVEPDLSELLTAWMRTNQDSSVVHQLVFGQEYAPEGLLEFSFLGYAQAAEAYHRVRFGGTAEAEDVHDARIQEVLDSAPEAHRRWLGDQLRWSNELSLRQRLRALFDHASPVMDEVADRRALVRLVVDTRNNLTHWDDADPGIAVQDLYMLTQAVRLLLKSCLLRDMGMDGVRCRDLVYANQHYLQLREPLRRLLGWSPPAPAAVSDGSDDMPRG